MDFVICNVTDEEELDAVQAFERRIFGGAAFARTGEYARENGLSDWRKAAIFCFMSGRAAKYRRWRSQGSARTAT